MNQPRKPSPAILVAVLALVAALAGTAVAGPDASTSAITKKKVKKIARKQINKLAPGLSVAHADTADTATNAENANTANTADSANTADNAQLLDGVDSSGFVRVDSNRVRTAANTDSVENYGNGANLLEVSNLAGGEYVITATLTVDNDGNNLEAPICELVAPGLVLDQAQNQLGPDSGAAAFLEYPLIGTFTASGAGTDDALIRCQQLGGDNDAAFRRIIAVRMN
jgi:hypothetical protein